MAIYKTQNENPSVRVGIRSPPEIFYNTKMRNQQHFGQAETDDIPFTQELLKTKFNWNDLMHEAELVLEDKYTDNNLTKVQQLFINHLQLGRVTTSRSCRHSVG